MSSTPLDTIDRYRAQDLHRDFLSPNLLMNGSFNHIVWEQSDPDLGHTEDWFKVPCWFPYGLKQDGNFKDPPAVTQGLWPNSGAHLTQNNGAFYGICQQIPDAAMLRGRRIRISGVHERASSPNSTNGGMSIWLKSGPKSIVTNNSTDWAAGGRGYETVRFASTVDIKHAVSLLPGTTPEPYTPTTDPAPSGQHHELLVRLYDRLEDDTIHTYLRFNGGTTEGVENRDGLTLWYLDDNFSGVPATDNSFELLTTVDPDSTEQYWEAYIDIPDDADLFVNNEVWLCIFPVNPNDIGSMDDNHQTFLKGITLEIVLDDTSAEDRIFYGMLRPSARPMPWGESALSTRFLYRYPIYAPGIVPMTVTNMAAADDSATAANAEVDIRRTVIGTSGGVPSQMTTRKQPGATIFTLLAKQGGIPTGASILRASVHVNHLGGTGGWSTPTLWQSFFTASNDWSIQKVCPISLTVGSIADSVLEGYSYRNRIGLYWPDSNGYVGGGTDQQPLNVGRAGPGEVFFTLNHTSADDQINVNSGYIQYVYDPRLSFGAAGMEYS